MSGLRDIIRNFKKQLGLDPSAVPLVGAALFLQFTSVLNKASLGYSDVWSVTYLHNSDKGVI